MAKRSDPTPEQMHRINNVTDAIAELLGVEYESVGTLSAFSVVLTVDQAEKFVEMLRTGR